ncbi:linear amide C-N hydrolase [Hyphomicrobium sp.]|uniref:linear amide C-N hydrolase n=1 Tax=Hyphomicrobium sp. TaxID=82 RepID=UPI003F71AE45
MIRKLHASAISAAVLGTSMALLAATDAFACTRVFWNTNSLAKVSGRTMDWPESTQPTLAVFPRGIARDGGKVGADVIVKENAAQWTSKYGSIVTTIYGVGAVDGLNERGLGAHLLYLNATDFGQRDPTKPGIQAALWAQYVLDNAATVAEALALLDKVQIVMAEARGHKANVHLALEDESGDSAIIEYIGGKPVVHHGSEYRIMTNDPSFDQQLALLQKVDFSNPRSDMPLPGNVNPVDRFQRAAYYSAMLREPKSERQAIAEILAIMRNVSVPFGAPYKGFGIYNTEYRTALNLTGKRYFFELTTSPNVVWADLAKFDLSEGAPAWEVDPDNIDLSGDISAKFQKLDKVPF